MQIKKLWLVHFRGSQEGMYTVTKKKQQKKKPNCITKVWHDPNEEGGLKKYWPKELWKWMECIRLEIKASVYKHSAIIAKVGSQGDASQQFWSDITCTPGVHK